jgi:hypothetical protein
MRSGLISHAKSKLIRSGLQTYAVPIGLYRGIKLNLDLQYNFQLFSGFWELETHRYLTRWSDYEWAIDVGAGAGELCLFILKHKTKISRIFAIEPDGAEVLRMKQNFQLNPELDEAKVIIIDRPVGDVAGQDRLCLDDLGSSLGSSPGLIKIDVDGYEIEVIRGAHDLLRGQKVDLLLETHSPSLEQQSIEILEGYGFTTKVIKNGWYRLIFPEQRPVEHNRWLWASNRTRF